MIKRLRERNPPMVLLFLALFHIVWTLIYVWGYFQETPDFSLPSERGYLIDVLTTLLMTVSWFEVTYMRKWAVYVYLGLFASSILAHLFTPFFGSMASKVSPLFPADLLACFFALVYFKRFS